jgi:asparagine synthase (glutamine-hydrolysing)
MSALAGIIYTHNRPAHAAELAPALDAMASMGLDGTSAWAAGGAALAHLALHTTPEARWERWPFINARGQVLVADARIDNRDELIRALRVRPAGEGPITDATLIMAAHDRWGDEAPAHLIGDFAYALWNPGKRCLRLVRSPLGMKGLYYHVDSERVVFATTLRGVMALAQQEAKLNLPWVASFLSRARDRLFDESPITGIWKVPPAHLISIEPATGSQNRHRYWDFQPDDSYAQWKDEDWIEAFQDTFEEAVAASLRVDAPLAMSVSGGLDSSSIALVAHRLMHQEQRVPPSNAFIHTLRMEGWPRTSEGDYRDIVVDRLPHFTSNWIDFPVAWTWEIVGRWHRLSSSPVNLPNGYTFEPRIERAREQGSRVMIAGVGGDMVTGGEDYALVAAFDSLPLSQRLQELRHFTRRRAGRPTAFAREWLHEHLPAGLRAWREKRRTATRLTSEYCESLATGKQLDLAPPDGLTPIQVVFRRAFMEPFFLQPMEQNGELLALHAMEYRCPFLHRPLLELAFHQPPHLRIARGQNRVLFKEALKQDLPHLLATRTSKANFTSFTAESISPEAHSQACELDSASYLWRHQLLDPATWKKWTSTPSNPVEKVLVHRTAHLAQWLSQYDI